MRPSPDNLKVDIPRIVEALELEPTLIGRELVCLCPFHKERGRSPNLEINSETGLFHCWVCAEKGNLTQLIMKLRTVGYREAINILEEYGDVPSVAEVRARNLRELDQILKPASSYTFEDVEISRYKHGRGWWHHVRHFDFETIGVFNLGYDSRSRRAVIPIGYRGKWVGIIRRATSDRQVPRYLYDKDFPKGRVLFAWDQVPDSANRCILVEGSTDCIRGHAAGYPNTLAILGTSITTEQQRLISERFDEVVLLMDNDPAGHIATLRNCEQLAQNMTKVMVATYDEIQKKDPDELSSNEWMQIVEEPTHWSYLFS